MHAVTLWQQWQPRWVSSQDGTFFGTFFGISIFNGHFPESQKPRWAAPACGKGIFYFIIKKFNLFYCLLIAVFYLPQIIYQIISIISWLRHHWYRLFWTDGCTAIALWDSAAIFEVTQCPILLWNLVQNKQSTMAYSMLSPFQNPQHPALQKLNWCARYNFIHCRILHTHWLLIDYSLLLCSFYTQWLHLGGLLQWRRLP